MSVIVKEVYEKYFTFIYKGQTIKCPNNKMSNGIYKYHKRKNDKIFYMGELFFFDKEWKRYDNKIYSAKYQEKLSKVFDKRFPFYKQSTLSLIEQARKANASKKRDIAISYFEIAMLTDSHDEIVDFIAELSSLYRKIKKPTAVIDLYKYLCKKYKDPYLPNPFFTSLAAAYLDVGDKGSALQHANFVFGRCGGIKDEELENLYLRINSYRD